VGYYQTADNRFHAFLLSGGEFTTIDGPDATDTGAPLGVIGINDSGEIAGGHFDASGQLHGFLRDSAGNFTTIDFPHANLTACTGLNNDGCIVGFYQDVDMNIHGFLFERK
jgi:hypothetical protein